MIKVYGRPKGRLTDSWVRYSGASVTGRFDLGSLGDGSGGGWSEG
jgi:hypothetical protein